MKERYTKSNVKSGTNWERLNNPDDNDIDYSDSPATAKEFWKNARVVMPEHKIHISLRLDENIVKHFKEQGRGYQSRINAVLRAYIQSKE